MRPHGVTRLRRVNCVRVAMLYPCPCCLRTTRGVEDQDVPGRLVLRCEACGGRLTDEQTRQAYLTIATRLP